MRLSPRVATGAIAAMAVVDVVLVGIALRSTAAAPTVDDSGATSVVATSSPSSTESSTPTTATSAAPSASSTLSVGPAPLQVEVVGVSTSVAWRIGVGSCDKGGASLTVTTDGGKSWKATTAPLRTIVRAKATTSQSAFVIGAGSGCTPQYASTGDGGGSWSAPGLLSRAWYRDPARPTVLRAPGPSTSAPCGRADIIDLAVVSFSRARVLCAGGSVRSTTDTGASWSDSGRVRGAVALSVPSATPSTTYVAVLGAAGCVGVQIQRVGQTGATSCAASATPDQAGQVALSVVDGGGWLTLGTRTLRSTDRLATWSAT